MNYEQALNYINSYTDYEKTPVPHAAANYDLRRVVELMGYFNNPHLKPGSIHVTGTKGKGSTAAMIASVLTAAGYSTGLYTSPHLLDLRERIRIGCELISESEFTAVMEKLVPAVEEVNLKAHYGKITTFEVLTALAFIYFTEKKTDFQVLEVGMGGTYDATNIIEKPEVCVLTSISYDHTDILGSTLKEIAGEKSGIIKQGCTVVSSPQQYEATQVIQEACEQKHAKLFKVGRDINWREIDYDINVQHFLVAGRLDAYDLTIPLLGQHQLINAAAAVGSLEVLIDKGFKISKDNIRRGLADVNWPGRFQVVGRHPLVVLDGAHNPDSARKLRETIERYLRAQKAVFVVGASSDKDIKGIVTELAPITGKVVATRAGHPRAMAPERIVSEFTAHKISAEIAPDVPAAVKRAVALAGENGFVCVTGSLFIVAEALKIAGEFGKC